MISARGIAALLGIALVLVVAAALRLHLDGRLVEPFEPYADQTFQALLVERVADPSAYEGDVMVEAIDRFWPDPYFQALHAISRLFPDLRWTWSALTLLVAGILLTGVYRLGRDLFSSPSAGWLAALATAWVPRDALIAEWAVVPLVPRFLTLAFAPWILHAVCLGSHRAVLLGMGACGLLASVHSLSALQLCFIAGGTMLLARRPLDWRVVMASPLAAAIGAIPAMLALPELGGGFDRLDLTALQRTCFAYFLAPFPYKVLQIVLGWAWLVGLAALALRALPEQQRRMPGVAGRFLLGLTVTSAALAALHALVVLFPSWLAFSPLRATKYLFLAAVLASAGAVGRLGAQRGWRRSLAVGLALGMCLPASKAVYDHVVLRVPGVQTWVRASLDRRPDIFFPDLPGRGSEAQTRAFAKVLRERVAPGEVILSPPRGASLLRLASRRAFYVLGEDSVVALYDRDNLRRFFRRYDRALAAYRAPDLQELRDLARAEGCRWILVPEQRIVLQDGVVQGRGLGLCLLRLD